jgi:photosystem II stability/assembly factor-like uncharacterized protein|tara:strand:- start:19312 stop:20502 length:1191 start_codon:yes stop_codon:yes gene_type:complete
MRFIKACFFMVTLSLGTTTVLAEWVDPLQTPAQASVKAHTALLLDITHAGDRLVAVGAFGHILYSDDNGQFWQQAQVPVSVTLTAVTFVGDRSGWAVGHDGVVLATADGGMSWHKQLDGFAANDAMVVASERLLAKAEAAVSMASDVGDEVLEDAEAALEAATFAVEDAEYDVSVGSTKPLLDVLFLDAQHGFAVGAYGMAFETSNGGKSWTEFTSRLPLPERSHLNSLVQAAYGQLYIVGELGLILTSTDQGHSWQALESPYDGSLFGMISSGNTLTLMGLRGHLFQSTDAGNRWTELALNNEQTLFQGLAMTDGTRVLVGNSGTLIRLEHQDTQVINLTGRKGIAGLAVTEEGFVLVGEAGVQRINRRGELIGAARMTTADGVSSGGQLAAEAQ